jgi:hypothetical protein
MQQIFPRNSIHSKKYLVHAHEIILGCISGLNSLYVTYVSKVQTSGALRFNLSIL